MVADTADSSRIGPQLSLNDVVLPRRVGRGIERLYGVDETPQTAQEWITVTGNAMEGLHDRRPTVEDLCTSDDGAHTFVGGGESQSYVCVLDPLAYPFLTGETGRIKSETPVRGETVEFEMRDDGFDTSHDEAVVSIGVSDTVDDADDVTLETVYRQICGYIHAFADGDEYETWAAEVDAATTSLPADEGVAVAREIVNELFETDGV